MPDIEEIQELLSRLPRGDRTSTVHLHPNDLERFRAEGHDDSTDALRTVRVQASRLVPPGNVYMTTEPEYLGRIDLPLTTSPLIEAMNPTNAPVIVPVIVSGIAGGTFMGGPFIPGKIVGVAGMQDDVKPELPRKSRWTLVDEEDPGEDAE